MEPKLTLELEPLSLEPTTASTSRPEPSPAAAPAAMPAAPAAPASKREDLGRFLTAAAREVEAGWIERPLWESILAQCKGDEAATRDAYIRMRATALKLEQREAKGPPATAPAAAAMAPREAARPAARKAAQAEVLPRRAAFKVDFRSPAVLAATAAVVLLLIGGGFWIFSEGSDAIAPTVTAAPKPAAAAAAHPATPAAVKSDTAPPDDGLVARIAKVRDVGNWNVVVLLCTEWTRREPANPAAWLQLSDGYLKLQQYAEALDAATHASQVAPTDAGVWRHLASVNVALDRFDDALRDYRQAVALDGRDVASLNRIGDIATRLGQYADAHAAYDQALALYPDDVDASCGQAFATRQQGLVKDADAIEKGIAARDHSCTDWKARHATEPSQATSYRTVKPGRGG
jgi:tetratricopeptide (TPR) repeat protein